MATATARRSKTDSKPDTIRVVALTHAFQDLHRYRRGDVLDLAIPDGQSMPAWCIAEADAPRTRDGQIDLNELPLFFPANTRI